LELFGFGFSFVPRRASTMRAEKGGRVSARSDRIGDAQEEAGHGRFLFT
jgi:hypothetical protein